MSPDPASLDLGQSEQTICGVVCATGRLGEPLACGFKKGHRGKHSWASQPTWNNGIDPDSVLAAAKWLAAQTVSPAEAKGHWVNAAAAIRHGIQRGLIRRK